MKSSLKKNSQKKVQDKKKDKKAPKSKPNIEKEKAPKKKKDLKVKKFDIPVLDHGLVMPKMVKPKKNFKNNMPGFPPVTNNTPADNDLNILEKINIFFDTPEIPPVAKKVFSPEEIKNGNEIKSKSNGSGTSSANTRFNSYRASKINAVVEFLNGLPADRKKQMLGYITSHETFAYHAGMSQSVKITCQLSNKLMDIVSMHVHNGGHVKDTAINHLENNL